MQGRRKHIEEERAATASENASQPQENTPLAGPTKQSFSRPARSAPGRAALMAALALVLIAGVTIGAVAVIKNTNFGITPGNTANQSPPGNAANTGLALNANGVASIIDQPGGMGHNNGITISVNSLKTPPSGYQYDAWFVDTTTKHSLALGALSLKDQAYGLTYSGSGADLVGLGNVLEITLEHGTASVPNGKILLSASFPPQAFVYVKRMLYSYTNTPGKIGLLVGLIEQAKLLNSVAHPLATNPGAEGTQCIAQSVLDIIEGTSGPNYKAIPANCAASGITNTGDGYGLLGAHGYIATTLTQDLQATNQPDATSNIHEHSRHVSYGLQDMQTWLTTAEQDALALLNNPTNNAKAQELATMASHAYYGYDADHDGTIDYIPGEAGAMIAYQHGQYMTAMVLAPN